MERIDIETGESLSAVLVGARWEAVTKLLPDENVIILTDENIFEIYGKHFPPFPVITIRAGEESKQLRVVEKLAKSMLEKGIDREGYLLAIGGGVVCDIAGFLASVYMRGIRCGYISTSLLSQVDASTGGKTGVNLGRLKNVIGTFSQPEFVICDTSMLKTLPREEYLSGLSEVIKTAIIGSSELLGFIENNRDGIMRKERDILNALVAGCVKFKGSVVTADEKESGLRRILNFGHTYGHAFELHLGLKHGFAVAAGMELAIMWSHEKGFISTRESDRFIGLLQSFGLLKEYKMTASMMNKLVRHDKKKSGRELYFIFTRGAGNAVPLKVTFDELTAFYRRHKG